MMGQEGHDLMTWLPAEVLEMIFSPLSIPDLLNCSMVNKSWRNSVGSIIWKHKKCYAYVKDPWVDLVKLNEMMEKNNMEMMINGLHVQIDRRKSYSVGLLQQNLQETLPHLLNWPFQFLHAEGYYLCGNSVSGAVTQVIREIFCASRGTVKELAFEFCSISYPNLFNFRGASSQRKRSRDGLIKETVYMFPKLKSIEFLIRSHLWDSFFYSFVLESAPNLLEIKGQPVSLGSVKFWNERTMQLLTSLSMEQYGLQLDESADLDVETLRKLIRSEARLRHLTVSDELDDDGPAFPPTLFDTLAQILRNSRYTLNEMEFCASELMKFLRVEGFSNSNGKSTYFPNVEKLHLSMPRIDVPRIGRSVLRRMSIGTNFPKLQQLDIDFGEYGHELEGEEYEWDYEDCPPSNLRIALYTKTRWCDQDPLEYLVKTFPLLTSLHVELYTFFDDDEHAYSFSDVFSSFKQMKVLHLKLDWLDWTESMPHVSLDAIFCGINFEEAARLRSDSENNGLELRGLEIVPIRPSLTSSSNLNELHVCLDLSTRNLLILEVAGVLAFDRMPHLEVCLEEPEKFTKEYNEPLESELDA